MFCQFACPAPFAKIFRFAPDPNHFHDPAIPSHRGGVAHVTDAGRDAVDAGGAKDEGANADGEVVWFWRPNAGVKSVRRSAGDGVK